jgi:hypothetical protein
MIIFSQGFLGIMIGYFFDCDANEMVGTLCIAPKNGNFNGLEGSILNRMPFI